MGRKKAQGSGKVGQELSVAEAQESEQDTFFASLDLISIYERPLFLTYKPMSSADNIKVDRTISQKPNSTL